MDLKSILHSGKDLLADQVLAQGVPTFETVRDFLPSITKGGYVFLSGAATQGAILVDMEGNLYDQEQPGMQCGSMLSYVKPFLRLSDEEPRIAGQKARFAWDANAPILQWHYDLFLKAEAFVHPLDPGVHPVLFLRIITKGKSRYRCFCTSGLQDVWPNTQMEISAEKYQTERQDALVWWKENMPPVQLSVGDDRWHSLLKRTLINGLMSFSGARPRYGHAYYSLGQGDNFPPAFITMAETLLLSGDRIRAAALVDHVFDYIVRADGAFAYYGPTAAEYGQWLLIAKKISRTNSTLRHRSKIRKIADHLLSMRRQDGLIESGAEADTRFRVAVYMNNNLWAVRGLETAAELLGCKDGCIYRTAANELLANVRQAMKDQSISTAYGVLPPFRLDYTAFPWSLSSCHETTVDVEANRLEIYLDDGYPTGDIRNYQDLSENTYANYRYYPEMLSSALLDDRQARAIMALRRGGGGEVLGMTRLFSWLDDWPVFNIARYLLEDGQRERYLLLLHTHTIYHGTPELGIYYEQVNLEGSAISEDCVPSLLTVPLMLLWAMVFEPIGKKCVLLGAGASPKWYENEVGIRNAGCGFGIVTWKDKPIGNGQREFIYELPPMPAPAYYMPPCGRTFILSTNPEHPTKGTICYPDPYGKTAV